MANEKRMETGKKKYEKRRELGQIQIKQNYVIPLRNKIKLWISFWSLIEGFSKEM